MRIAWGVVLAVVATAGAAQQAPTATVAPGGTLRVLDRMTGQLQDVELANGETVELGKITVGLQECRFPTGNPSGDAFAYVDVNDPLVGETVFSGWMIASAPALNALDHGRYDVWVIRCKTS
ncbi:MAG: DUF2155 domain-containing protein [Pseudomonadota bacterium]